MKITGTHFLFHFLPPEFKHTLFKSKLSCDLADAVSCVWYKHQSGSTWNEKQDRAVITSGGQTLVGESQSCFAAIRLQFKMNLASEQSQSKSLSSHRQPSALRAFLSRKTGESTQRPWRACTVNTDGNWTLDSCTGKVRKEVSQELRRKLLNEYNWNTDPKTGLGSRLMASI